MGWVTDADSPLSHAVRVTSNCPPFSYTWIGLHDVSPTPSPKLHTRLSAAGSTVGKKLTGEFAQVPDEVKSTVMVWSIAGRKDGNCVPPKSPGKASEL